MSHYIDKSHVEDLFGVENVASWSNLDNDQASANEQRIERAIAWAQSYIDDRFAGSRYRVPLLGVHGPLLQVQDWAAWLAGWWLRRARSEDPAVLQRQLDSVNRQMELVLRGQVHLPAVLASEQRGAKVVR